MISQPQIATVRPTAGVAAGLPLVEVRDLCKYFPVRRGLLARAKQWVKAVDGVSFDIYKGETLGLVGESGCGKTTVGRTLLCLQPATGGSVRFEGRTLVDKPVPDLSDYEGVSWVQGALNAIGLVSLLSGGGGRFYFRRGDSHGLPRNELRALRPRMQIIFQDPYGSLNPRMTVGSAIAEPLRIHRAGKGETLRARVAELLGQVGLPADAMNRYPHEFSGGQRQRVGIARALALNPSFIVCDEPTSALDVSIRAQVINLLQDLQRRLGLSYLMISHDLAAVRHISTRVAVMYLGRIVEEAPTKLLYDRPRHPYTRVLLSAIPVPDPATPRKRVTAVDDEVPSPINVPTGCAFYPRCPLYELLGKPEQCRRDLPELAPVEPGSPHAARCHFQHEIGKLDEVAEPV